MSAWQDSKDWMLQMEAQGRAADAHKAWLADWRSRGSPETQSGMAQQAAANNQAATQMAAGSKDEYKEVLESLVGGQMAMQQHGPTANGQALEQGYVSAGIAAQAPQGIDTTGWTPEQIANLQAMQNSDGTLNNSQNLLDAIKVGSGSSVYTAPVDASQKDLTDKSAYTPMSVIQQVAQNGLDPTQGPGQYNMYSDAAYLNAGGGLANQQIGNANNVSQWAATTDYDSLMAAGSLDAARTHTMNMYATGQISAEEAQELENQAFEQHYGSLEHTYKSVENGKDNVLSGESWVQTTITPTDYSTLTPEQAFLQAESHNNIDNEFVSVEGLGGQLFKMAVTGALTAGAGAALAPSIAGLSAGAQGAINGGLNSAIGGVVSGDGLDLKNIGVGALTGGVGGSLSNADGMLGGFIDTGSNIADDAIKGAITGGIGGAFDGDVLGGALMGGATGAGTNLLEQGVGWAGDKINGLKDDLTGPGEFDFAQDVMDFEGDDFDQYMDQVELNALTDIIPGGEYHEIPDSVQEALDQQAIDDYYSPPEQIQVGNQDIIDQMNENDLNAALDYENSDEFVGPGISGAADYDHTTPAGQILDNMTQEDVISESYLFDQYGREMDGTYTIGEIDGKTSIIETATGNYVTSEATAGNPFEVGDPRRSFYEQLSEFDKHLYMAGTLPSAGLSASPVDFLEDVPDEVAPEQVEQEQPEEQEQQQQDPAESDPVNNTDTSLDSGKKGGGTDGTPSNPVDTAVGSILANLEDEQLQAVLSQNPNLAQNIADQISDLISQNTTDSTSDSQSTESTESQQESQTETQEEAESEAETGSEPTNDDPSPAENNSTPSGSTASNIAQILAAAQAAAAASGGAVDGATNASGNPDATPGGQNTDNTGNGGLDNGTGTGANNDDGSGVQTGGGTGTGEEGTEGGDDKGNGDPGIGAGFGGMLAGLGAGSGMGGGNGGDGPQFSPLYDYTKLPQWQKRRHQITMGLLQELMRRA